MNTEQIVGLDALDAVTGANHFPTTRVAAAVEGVRLDGQSQCCGATRIAIRTTVNRAPSIARSAQSSKIMTSLLLDSSASPTASLKSLPGTVMSETNATSSVANINPPAALQAPARTAMSGKPVLYRNAKTAITFKSEAFQEKRLCDGITLNLGDACVYSCQFCYVQAQMMKLDSRLIKAHNEAEGRVGDDQLGFRDVVIRRKDAVELVKSQLTHKDGSPRFSDPNDNRVIYSSTLVDVAANKELLHETAKACNVILEKTNWQIRLLSKSSLLHLLVKDGLIPEKYHHRMIFGFSTGTLDDRVAKAIETGTALVSKRLESLHWLQDHGCRTFGMVCPSLPQLDYDYATFSKEICDAIRIDKCEHVWAEVINVRGQSLTRTLGALNEADLDKEAMLLEEVQSDRDNWEVYARATFEAHTKNVPATKLRFLQYIDKSSAPWWAEQREHGAVLIGKVALDLGLTSTALDNKN